MDPSVKRLVILVVPSKAVVSVDEGGTGYPELEPADVTMASVPEDNTGTDPDELP